MVERTQWYQIFSIRFRPAIRRRFPVHHPITYINSNPDHKYEHFSNLINSLKRSYIGSNLRFSIFTVSSWAAHHILQLVKDKEDFVCIPASDPQNYYRYLACIQLLISLSAEHPAFIYIDLISLELSNNRIEDQLSRRATGLTRRSRRWFRPRRIWKSTDFLESNPRKSVSAWADFTGMSSSTATMTSPGRSPAPDSN